ncbi:phosphomethylethanolamine N-methyltransferase-like protein [Leptotrombidium deliense]|uniref:Phosphomethylethanolamine N-methyltransferase-like protein n=1 Tax=Leptotrombidium deliense TaxID=299467 RepID=A0A443S6Y0_9ACAR|nr:phosphomethylethanolamine N-methyltransferase-like protein [Leptotrombidium deliense]
MNPNPKQYNDNNEFQRYEAAKLFSTIKDDFGPSPKFRSVVDIGCGTGKVTLDFLQYAKCDHLIAFDKNENMVEFARQNNKSNEISYEVSDITHSFTKLKCDIKLVDEVDLVYSVYCLHFVEQKAKIFNNIFHLLKAGGKCYLMLLYWSDLFAYQHQFAENSKWNKYIPNFEAILSQCAPFHKAMHPEIGDTVNEWRKLLETFGFTKCTITVEKDAYLFKNFNEFKLFLEPVCPIINMIPKSERKEFIKDYFEFIRINYNQKIKPYDDSYEWRYEYCIIKAEKC